MCGIAGTYHDGPGVAGPDLLERMLAVLGHRGPDESGIHREGPIGLAHARLSILDLSLGQQPMRNQDGSLWISFNGEIFNYLELRAELAKHGHRFASRSDTEVILHLYEEYGDDCVEHMNGQWAFALWDGRRRRLVLSRDRLGIRPLFYTWVGDTLLFASEIKALLLHPAVSREIDPLALTQIFTFWVALAPRTPFRDVHELPPAHTLLLEDGVTTLRRHWQLDYGPRRRGPVSRREENECADQLLELLEDATRIRLRADVPVGAYLSGGLDSTVTTALALRASDAPLQTFSVTFDDPQYDESRWQREAVAHLGTQHREIGCGEAEIGRSLPQVIWHTEKPILRTAPAPLFLLSRLVRDSGFKVVITGEGADEALGGYDIFKEAKIRRFCAQQPDSRYRPLLLRRLYPYMPHLQSQSLAYLKSFFHIAPDDLASPFFSHLPRWGLAPALRAFFSGDLQAACAGYDPLEEMAAALPPEFEAWDAFSQAQYLETAYLLPGYILSSQGDRMAMAHSVEGRFPFLDHRVMEFAARLHPSLKMKVLNEKHLLKRCAASLVPPAMLQRPKQPYRAPEGTSFYDPQNGSARHAFVEELLSTPRIRRDGLFRAEAVRHLVDKVRRGRAIGVKDNMALTGILSTQLLIDQLIHNETGSLHDGRGTAEAETLHH